MLSFMFTPNAQSVRLKLSLIYAGLYIIICSGYIYFSDHIAHLVAQNYEQFYFIQTVKGFAFMFLSGLALFVLLYTGMGRFLRAKEIIRLQRESIVMTEHRVLTGLLSSATLHDINNFLMIVHMHLEVIEADIHLDAEAKRSLAKVHVGLNNMLESTRHLLNFTKESSEKTTLSVMEVRPFINQAWSLLSSFCKEKTIHFSCHEESPGIQATLHSPQLKQALMNILLNSIQAIESEGIIEVVLRSSLNETLIEIHDSGPGVPPSERSKIFQPNYSTKKGGTGLGLVSSRFCLEAINGKIEVGSSHLKGACFRIRLAHA